MPAIFTLTFNPCIDVHTSVDRLLPDIKLSCAQPLIQPGGGGINVARAIHQLGGHADAIFPCGGDHCRTLKVLLACEKVGYIAVDIPGDTRENLIVLDRSSQLQYKLNMPGPGLDPHIVDAMLDVLRQQESLRYIVVSGSLPAGVSLDTFGRLKALAAQRHALLVIDTSGDALKAAVAVGADLVKLSVHELATFTGVEKFKGHEDIQAAATRLLDNGVARVVVSLGPKGAIWLTANDSGYIPAPPATPQSTVGAGDSMLAGIVLSLSKGKSLGEAVEFGVACGTAATLQPGTTLCDKKQVATILAGMRAAGTTAIAY